jgi:hypothetical protein
VLEAGLEPTPISREQKPMQSLIRIRRGPNGMGLFDNQLNSLSGSDRLPDDLHQFLIHTWMHFLVLLKHPTPNINISGRWMRYGEWNLLVPGKGNECYFHFFTSHPTQLCCLVDSKVSRLLLVTRQGNSSFDQPDTGEGRQDPGTFQSDLRQRTSQRQIRNERQETSLSASYDERPTRRR